MDLGGCWWYREEKMLSVVYVMDSFVNPEVFVRAPLQGNLVHSALLKMTGTDKHWWNYIMYLLDVREGREMFI